MSMLSYGQVACDHHLYMSLTEPGNYQIGQCRPGQYLVHYDGDVDLWDDAGSNARHQDSSRSFP